MDSLMCNCTSELDASHRPGMTRDGLRSADHQAHALGANDRRGPVPAGSLREIDHPDATDQVLEWNIAYRGKHTAIGGVVPVVTQHEEVTGRHRVDVGIVVESPLDG